MWPTRTSSLKFFLVSPPNPSSKASEVQPISMRKLQRVVEVHRIHHRATLNLHASKSGLTWRRLSGVETDPIRGVGCTGVWGDM
ncbi:hypothetical protein Prudu_011656 [Prunus dulcis]|uniref:Uncharacterized protein n=1 Tax=Prunus dulcis TaxID=3755 RepID=A0A4Y1RB22_PRUDU|nr:hypothetical protein Prudu_011656 [Prunus dulcis]